MLTSNHLIFRNQFADTLPSAPAVPFDLRDPNRTAQDQVTPRTLDGQEAARKNGSASVFEFELAYADRESGGHLIMSVSEDEILGHGGSAMTFHGNLGAERVSETAQALRITSFR